MVHASRSERILGNISLNLRVGQAPFEKKKVRVWLSYQGPLFKKQGARGVLSYDKLITYHSPLCSHLSVF